MPADLAAAYAFCENLVREERRDAWLAALFGPAPVRPALYALQAFFVELERVRSRVSQPLAGELRLQWWLDAITGEARGGVSANPVAAALLDTMQRHDVSGGGLIDAIEAYRTGLYDTPPADERELEDMFGRTIGGLIRSQLKVLTGDSLSTGRAPDDAAAATGFAGLLLAFANDPARAAALIPGSILSKHRLAPGDIAAGVETPAVEAVLTDLRGLARAHLADLRAARAGIPEAAGPAFLTTNLIEPLLRLSVRRRARPSIGLALSPWRRQWILWRAARRGGIL